MKIVRTSLFCAALLQLTALIASAAVYNGDFEMGNISGWTTSTTYNGTLGGGMPDVVSFDTDGDGHASLAARFQVGEITYIGDGHTPQGGSIFQNFSTTPGVYVISADYASQGISGVNVSPGKFDLYIDGVLRNSQNFDTMFGNISGGQIYRSSFSTALFLGLGSHSIQIQMTRPWLSGGTPYQYLDDIQVAPVPEPAVSTLALTGAFVLWCRARRAKSGRA